MPVGLIERRKVRLLRSFWKTICECDRERLLAFVRGNIPGVLQRHMNEVLGPRNIVYFLETRKPPADWVQPLKLWVDDLIGRKVASCKLAEEVVADLRGILLEPAERCNAEQRGRRSFADTILEIYQKVGILLKGSPGRPRNTALREAVIPLLLKGKTYGQVSRALCRRGFFRGEEKTNISFLAERVRKIRVSLPPELKARIAAARQQRAKSRLHRKKS